MLLLFEVGQLKLAQFHRGQKRSTKIDKRLLVMTLDVDGYCGSLCMNKILRVDKGGYNNDWTLLVENVHEPGCTTACI